MKRSEDRILTTHVGSIVRPKELIELVPHPGAAPVNLDEYNRRLEHAGRHEPDGEGLVVPPRDREHGDCRADARQHVDHLEDGGKAEKSGRGTAPPEKT